MIRDALLLALALAGVAWFAWPTDNFPRTRLRWVVRATLAFVVPALVALAVLGRFEALIAVPPEFARLAARLPRMAAGDVLLPILGGIPLGLGIVQGRIWWARRRGVPVPPSIVAPALLAARNRRELLPAVGLAVAAGVTEELAFRLAIPLLVTLVVGDPLIGFAVASAAFVALHRYQAWPGRIGVALSAVALAVLYLMTGALWLVVVVHALVDVMGLAVRPWLAGFGASAPSSSAATPSGRSR